MSLRVPQDGLSYAQRLRIVSRLSMPAAREAVASLAVASGSHGLDAGCGIGQHLCSLAEAAGPSGRVTGLDIDRQLLEIAEDNARQRLGPARVAFCRGNMKDMPFDDNAFGWAICADALWAVPAPQQDGSMARSAVDELVRVVRPGGWVALLFWSAQSFLPGYPELEARLGVAHTKVNPYLQGIHPQQHFLRALGWLRSAKLQRTEARCYVAEAHAPIDPELRTSLDMCFDMFWGGVKPHVTREDWAEYQRLCRPDSPDFIADRDDYFCLVVYTLFCGWVPA